MSRYSDPNSAATNGGFVGLVSGGNLTSPRYRRQQRRRQEKLGRDGQVVGRRRLVAEVSLGALRE